jgi:hypothetical protein
MTIPNFKSQDDYQEYLNLFDDRWQVKFTLLNRVKDDLFPGFEWHSLTPKSIETINDIVQSLLYDVELTFCKKYPEYDEDRLDDVFIPRRTFKEDVTEALKEALNDRVKEDCPPCDTLACADHLTDE